MTASNLLPAVPPIPIHDELIEAIAERGGGAVPSMAERGDALFVDLVWTLTNLKFAEDEARGHWSALLEHKYHMSERMGRNVGIRVAALDYFTNIQGRLVHPRIVDPELLERLYAEATIDPLTGLPNRRYFRERILAEVARAERHGGVFTLGVYDLDDFKKLNDSSGHATGDLALRKLARLLRATSRESDLVARWGGEEFILLLPETDKRSAALLAERQRARVQAEFATMGLTISGGLAAYPRDGATEEALFAFADKALYRAKGTGKNRICLAPHERRAFPRLDENLHVHLASIPQEGSGSQATRTRNVGAGGVCVLYPEPVPVATLVSGLIRVEGRSVAFEGRVTRVEEMGEERYEVGIAFLDIHPSDRDLLLVLSNG